MAYFRRQWYDIGGVVALVVFAFLILFWDQMDMLRRLQVLSFIALLVHQFEEYRFPGGEPAIMNMVIQPSDTPDHYPLNQNSAMITNVFVAYIVYLLAILFPNVIWLGLGTMFMGFGQVLFHGVLTNIRLKGIYNPGLASAVFLFLPIGAYYIYYVISNGLVQTTDWILAFVYAILIAGLGIGALTYRVLADRNSPYPFDQVEMERFGVKEKMAKAAGK